MGEDAVIAKLVQGIPLAEHVQVGPGDDCAVIDIASPKGLQLLKTDTIVENVHFLRTAEPFSIGWKAAARVVSDFAAMGGQPDSLVVALAVPKELPFTFLSAIYEGIYACAEAYHFSIVGGETSSSKEIILTLSGTGYATQPILRSGAKPGDSIYLTGQIGGSIAGKHLTFQPRVQEAQWLCTHLPPNAMMDLSDGLAKDLPRLAEQSKVGFDIDLTQLPCTPGCSPTQALSDGEDYELLFTTQHPLDEHLHAQWRARFPNTPLTKIGTVTRHKKTQLEGGWEHFSNSSD